MSILYTWSYKLIMQLSLLIWITLSISFMSSNYQYSPTHL